MTPCSVSGCSNPSEPKGSWCFECSSFDRELTVAHKRADALFMTFVEAPNAPVDGPTLMKLACDLDVLIRAWRRKSHQ